MKKKEKKVVKIKSRKSSTSRQKMVQRTRNKMGMATIKVIGVGGGGGNAVSRMMTNDIRIKGVEFIAVNTDAQDLDYAEAHKKIYIGKALTRGLGAGMNPEVGKQAAEENRSEIGEVLNNTDVLFITAGMGGGTGTGATPIIAEIAREKGILTIAIVTKPFSFEGSQRMTIAQDGVNRLKDKVDALVVIPNDRIFSLINKDTPVLKAFSHIDEILKNGVQAIAELINVPGIINVDFSDIKTIVKDAGMTLIGIGIGSGADRGVKAVQAAVNSPLLETSIDGAKGILFTIAGSRDLKMTEISDIAKIVSGNLDANAKVIFGAYYDKHLKDKNIKVTVIATGFNGIYGNSRMNMPSLFSAFGTEAKKKEQTRENFDKNKEKDKSDVHFASVGQAKTEMKEEDEIKLSSQKEESWNGLEIPAFLRKRKK